MINPLIGMVVGCTTVFLSHPPSLRRAYTTIASFSLVVADLPHTFISLMLSSKFVAGTSFQILVASSLCLHPKSSFLSHKSVWQSLLERGQWRKIMKDYIIV